MNESGTTNSSSLTAAATADARVRLSRFLEGGLKPGSDDPRLLRQVRVLNGLMLTAMLLCLPLGILWSALLTPKFAFVYTASFALWAGLLIWLRKSRQVVLVGRAAVAVLYGVCTATVILIGNSITSILAWYMLIPLAAAVCIGRRDLWFWVGLAMATPIFFHLFPQADHIENTALLPAWKGSLGTLVLVVGALITSILTNIWIAHHEHLAQRLDDSVAKLEKEAAAHKLLIDTAMHASGETKLSNGARNLLNRLQELEWVDAVCFWDTCQHPEPSQPFCKFPDSAVFEPSTALSRTIRTGERAALEESRIDGQRAYYPIRDGERVAGVIEVCTRGAHIEVHEGDWLVRQVAIQLGHIAERERTAAIIQREARFDALTGLHNRRAFQEIIETEIAAAQQQSPTQKIALLFVDLNDFKRINDSLGHAAGDSVLKVVAERLNQAIRHTDSTSESLNRPKDAIARVGGDEFTVLLSGIRSSRDAEGAAARILEVLSTPIHLDKQQFKVGASIGIAMFPEDALRADVLIHAADAAMYSAKRRGLSGFSRYHDAHRAVNSLSFEAAMRHALDTDQLEMYYQPVFSCQSGEPAGAEALIRWRHPERGWISPADFIPLAEKLGLISDIGRFQCTTALQWFAQNRHQLPTGFRLALNLSPAQIEDEAFIHWLTMIVRDSGLPTSQIELELTETALLTDTPETHANLAVLTKLGLCIALDDFGTGQSSLSLLKRFPIGRIKIDRSFVNGLPDRSEDVAIVAAVLSLAQSLNIPTVAEGVEDEAQRMFLANRKCDELQGYLLAKPMPGHQLLEQIRDSQRVQVASHIK